MTTSFIFSKVAVNFRFAAYGYKYKPNNDSKLAVNTSGFITKML